MLLRDTPRPAVRRLQAGEVLTRQGDPGDELYIIVDGVLVVSVDGVEVVELGPGRCSASGPCCRAAAGPRPSPPGRRPR